MIKRLGLLFYIFLCVCFFIVATGGGPGVSAQEDPSEHGSSVRELEQEIIDTRQSETAWENTPEAYDPSAYESYEPEAPAEDNGTNLDFEKYPLDNVQAEESGHPQEDLSAIPEAVTAADTGEPKVKESECLTCDLASKPKQEGDFERVSASSKRLALMEASGERMTIDFKESELDKVFRLLSEWAGINIILDPKLRDIQVTLHLKDVTLNEAMEIVFSSYDLKKADLGDSIFVSSAERINSLDSLTKTVQLRNVKAKNIGVLLKDVVRSIATDEEANAIVITGAPYQIEEALRIIAKVDQPQKQVLLTTQVLEVSYDSTKEVGIDWSDSTSFSFQEQYQPGTITGEDTLTGQPTPLHLYRLARSAIKFDMTIKHLLETGKAKLLANPKITAVNNKEAHIFIGDRIPYEVTINSGGTVSTEVRFEEVGIKLALTPSIIEEDYVVVTVAPEVSFIAGWRGADDQYPWVRTRQAEASMRVKDGETFILGGLLSEEDKNNVYKVPFFCNIPLLGNLFKYEKKEIDKKEIIITVTPKIISK